VEELRIVSSEPVTIPEAFRPSDRLPTATKSSSEPRRNWNHLLWPLLLAAVTLFAVRGLYRGVRPHLTNDFFSVYSISKAWVAGKEPYSTPVIVRTFQDASGYKLGRNTLAQAASYSALPGMVPIAAPFTALRWRAANSAWVLLSIAALGMMLWMFARSSGASRNDVLAFLICCLALGPIHTGLSGSNVTPLLVGLMGISYLLLRRGRSISAGILLGVVGCCKPHIAGAMVLVLIVDREWKTLRVAVITGFVSLGLFVGRLWAVGVPWWNDFLQRTRQFGAVGDANDFSLANPARYELTNLQVILGSITSSRSVANLVAISVGGLPVAAWWVAVKRNGKSDLLGFAAINIILLLPSYHRFDDASVLVYFFAAAFLVKSRDEWIRRIAIATGILFVFPIQAASVHFAESSGLSGYLLSQKAAFQLSLLTCHIWILLLISLALVFKLNKPDAKDLAHAPGMHGSEE